jgi:hypothetical protein
LVVPQPYSPSEEELQEVFLLVMELNLPGIENDIESFKAIVEFLSPMAPIPLNATHNGPASLTSAESLAFDNYSNPNKFEKKAFVTILGTHKGYEILHQKHLLNLRDTMISKMKMDHLFNNLPRDLWNLICNQLEPLWGRAALNLSTSHTPRSKKQLEQSFNHFVATGSPPIPYFGHPWTFGLGDEDYPLGLTHAAHGISSKLAKNLSGNPVSISNATLR